MILTIDIPQNVFYILQNVKYIFCPRANQGWKIVEVSHRNTENMRAEA